MRKPSPVDSPVMLSVELPRFISSRCSSSAIDVIDGG
jgi:hypothetical protein